jgi:hypothetical protein
MYSDSIKHRGLSSKLYQRISNDPRIEELDYEDKDVIDEDGEPQPSLWWIASLHPGFKVEPPYTTDAGSYAPSLIATRTLSKMLWHLRRVVVCDCNQCKQRKKELNNV